MDGELDGQPDAHALGDDNDGTDDDDGVDFLTKLIPGQQATVAVVLSGSRIGDGHANQEEFFAWIDFNQNGHWEDSEMVIRQPIDTHTGTCTFLVPQGARLGTTYARFALDILSTHNPDPKPTNQTISWNDIGEIEDYEIVIGEDGPYPGGGSGHGGGYDYGDAPETVPDFTISAVGPAGGAGSIGIREVVDNGVIGDQVTCHSSLHSGGGTIVDYTAATLNIEDGGVTGRFSGDSAFAVVVPVHHPYGSVENLSLVARGAIRVPADGDYTFCVGSDDGFTLQFPGYDFQSFSGDGEIAILQGGAALRFRGDLAFADTLGVIYLPTGDHPFVLTYHEHQGSASVELSAAVGAKTAFDSSSFRLVGNPGGLQLVEPPDYPTLMVSNGARHTIVQGIHLGAGIDGEPDGRPVADALGDDRTGIPDDEDGVNFLSPLEAGQSARVQVFAAADGKVDAWIDFDADGSWAQTSDSVFTSRTVSKGSNSLSFNVPAQVATGVYTFARIRFSIQGGLSYTGSAANGEVEDHRIWLGPDGPYPAGPPIGGDCGDANGDGVVDMTDAIYILNYLYIGGPPPVCDPPYNCADTNGNGSMDMSDAIVLLQHLFLGYPLPSNACCPGPGEQQLDWGDAPLPYPEASHQLGGPYLAPPGDSPDPEQGMQRNTQASGDNNDLNGDDENGLVDIDLMKIPGGGWCIAHIKRMAAPWQEMRYKLWIDVNIDGDWDDPGELVWEAPWTFGVPNAGIGGGSDLFWINLPANTKAGRTYARLRIWDDNSVLLPPGGPGGPGEVEDYEVEIEAGSPALPAGGIIVGLKWNDLDGDGFPPDPGEPPLAGWTIRYDSNSDGVLDSQDASTTTDIDGHRSGLGQDPGDSYR